MIFHHSPEKHGVGSTSCVIDVFFRVQDEFFGIVSGFKYIRTMSHDQRHFLQTYSGA